MKQNISGSLASAIAIIAMTVTLSVTMILAMKLFDRTVSDVNEKQAMYNKLAEIDKSVRDNFYTEINDQTLYDMIATGYIAGLGDRNSKYYTAKQVIERNDIASGKLMGIGADLIKDTSGYFKIVKIYSGSPAETAGLTKGTLITKLNDTDLKSLTLDSVNSLLRGESGTTVTVTYLKDNVETAVDIQRSVYEIPLVEYQLIEDSVGYIRIFSFSEDTAARVDYAVNSLTSQGATSLIFDVRDNADGSLSAAAECADLLCPAGTIVSGTYRDGETRVLYTSDENEVTLPMVVITNESTSGAAELFAVSVRDLRGGKIVGATTAGKGTLQRTYSMSDGSAIDLTVAVLVPGKSDSFDGTGVMPDYERVLSADEKAIYYEFTVTDDPQILRAQEVAVSLAAGNTGEGPAGGADSSAPASSSTAQDAGAADSASTALEEAADSSSTAQADSSAADSSSAAQE